MGTDLSGPQGELMGRPIRCSRRRAWDSTGRNFFSLCRALVADRVPRRCFGPDNVCQNDAYWISYVRDSAFTNGGYG